jgi:hypothetical protein
MAEFVERLEEVFVPAKEAVKSQYFQALGMTDAAVLTLSAEEVILFTSDAELHRVALASGKKAENFNHWRVREGLL